MQRKILSKTSVKSVWGVRVCVSGKGGGISFTPLPPPKKNKNKNKKKTNIYMHGATRSLPPLQCLHVFAGEIVSFEK